jgi:hypothetical protein
MRLLTSYEILESSPQLVKESLEQNNGRLILSGVIQRADVLNQNGRIYPRSILEREIRNYQKFIIENRATGELDHPQESVISLQKVSHIMRKAEMQHDGTVLGSIEILDTPCGKIVKSLVETGVKIGISSRGVGSVEKEDNYLVVQDDFQLICFDVVSDPSTSSAWMLPEGKQISESQLDKLYKSGTLNRSDRINRIANEILFPTK